MNEEYWEEFYRKFSVSKPSTFAKFCMDYIDKDKGLIDVGCGNGRDAYYFARQGVNVFGVDKANQPKNSHNATFLKNDYHGMPFNKNQIYARFFLHSIENLEIAQFLLKCEDLVMLEFRNIGDVPVVYPDHRRNFIDGGSVVVALHENNFEILYLKTSKGLSKFKNEDPLLCRIIARKKF